MRAADRAEDGLRIERHQRSHVHNFAVDPVFRLELLGGIERPRHHQRQGQNGGVLAGAHHAGAAQSIDDLALGNVALRWIERFVLEEDDGIGIADRGGEQPDDVAWVRGGHHLEPGNHHRPVLDALAMLGAEAGARAIGGAHHERAFELAVRHVAALRELVGDIVEAHRKKIREHDLGDGLEPRHCRAHGGAQDSLLGNRTVAHALWAELFVEADRGLEHAASLGHVFAEEDDVGIARHLLGDAAGDRIAVGQFRHAKPPSA